MQQTNTITLFATVSKTPTNRVSKNQRSYVSFGISVITSKDQPPVSYNVIAFGRQASFAKQLAKGIRVKLTASPLSQPENSAKSPLLNATFLRQLRTKTTQAAA
jgi:hypothetical protein